MRFLVDECTRSKVAKWLCDRGYEVFSVYDRARGISDDVILEKAVSENWILITNDKDFGEKIYRERRSHRDIVLIRLADERFSNKIEVLSKLLSKHSAELLDNYVVITENQIRFAKGLSKSPNQL
jgi:predicted nuclease of predicted toxin-antitoxin system